MRSLAVLLVGSCVAGCYLAHERDADGAVTPDVATTTDVGCGGGTPAELRFEPPLAMLPTQMPVLLLGAEADAASGGVRLHFTCSSTPGCRQDMIVTGVGDALAGVSILDRGASGTLSVDATGTSAFLHVTDVSGRFDPELNVLAGAIRSTIDPSVTVTNDQLDCTAGCGGAREIRIAGRGGSIVVAGGAAIDGPAGSPLRIALLTSAYDPCVVCDCVAPTVPATGIVLYDQPFRDGRR